MAIINCPECGNNISDTRDVCIHCGYVLRETKKKKPIRLIIIVTILAIFVLFLINGLHITVETTVETKVEDNTPSATSSAPASNTVTSPAKANSGSTQSNSSSKNDENYKKATEKLSSAEEYLEEAASLIIQNWTNNSQLEYYFGESGYKKAVSKYGTLVKNMVTDLEDVRTNRKNAEKLLDEAKQLIGSNGDSDYYKAVKSFYVSVDDFLTLLSESPDTYTRKSFSDAVNSCKKDCKSEKSNLAFYQ